MAERLLVLLLFFPSLGNTTEPDELNHLPELPYLVKKALDEFLANKYLHAVADAFLLESQQQVWDPVDALKYLLLHNSSLSFGQIRSILAEYQMSLIHNPQRLVSELSVLDMDQFTTVLRLLFAGRREQTLLLEVDFSSMKASVEASACGNRSLFAVARDKCVSALRTGHCVDLMGSLLSLSDGQLVQEDYICDLPVDLPDDSFRNLTAVFKDLYDMFSATTQKAVYSWIVLGLQKTLKSSHSVAGWITAENLWFLGRYMVHLPMQDINRISLSEMRTFIHYDNATKQLDCVYDIKPGPGKALLRRVNASGFDMANVSIAYRLGLLVCFYESAQLLDASDARNLLHQLIKCNQLRASLTEVQKLKSQLLDTVIRNQTLNESLGSISDAVVGLTPSQLVSLSASAVRNSMGVLQQAAGWTQSQTIILVQKYMGDDEVLTLRTISELGSLISGLDASLFYTISPVELTQAMESMFVHHSVQLNPSQQHAVISQMLTAMGVESAVHKVPSSLFSQIPLAALLQLPALAPSAVQDKALSRSQAYFLYEFLSKTTPTAALIRTGQLLKGLTCDKIQRLTSDFLIENFSIFEKKLHLLSPFQMNCLVWRYWDILDMTNSSMPPLFIPALPLAYVESMPAPSCTAFLVAMRDLGVLTVNGVKRDAAMNKVLLCLAQGIGDEYTVDILGTLLCHMPPAALRDLLSVAALPAALRHLRLCSRLTLEHKSALRDKLLQLYGNPGKWSSELIQDLGPLITLMSREDILVIANEHPQEVLSQTAYVGQKAVTEDFLSVVFEMVRGDRVGSPPSLDLESECSWIQAPSVDDIRKLSQANVYWSAAELNCLTVDTFTETVDILGSVTGFNTSQLLTLKSHAVQTWGPVSTWMNYHVTSLGSIALALTEEDIKEMDLRSSDTLGALSRQTTWTLQQMRSLLYRFLQVSGLGLEDLRGPDLAGMGRILCGVEPAHVYRLAPEAYSAVAAQIGTLSCPLPVLQQLRRTAEKVFGKASSWNSSVLQEVGVVAAGMSSEDLTTLKLDQLPYLMPQAIAAIPPESLRELSREQLQSLGPENAHAVTSSQLTLLSEDQLKGLQAAREGLREGLSGHLQPAGLSDLSTSTTSSGAALGCAGLWWIGTLHSAFLKRFHL